MSEKDTDQSLIAYKRFIDALVEFVKRQSVAARRIRLGEKIFHGYTEHDTKYNQFVRDLSPEQRELVADLVQEERQGIIGDILAFLTWEKYQLSKNGTELAFEPFATENYYDMVCRLEGDTWPDERTDEENP